MKTKSPRIRGILCFQSSCNAPPAKRSQKGYGDGNGIHSVCRSFFRLPRDEAKREKGGEEVREIPETRLCVTDGTVGE